MIEVTMEDIISRLPIDNHTATKEDIEFIKTNFGADVLETGYRSRGWHLANGESRKGYIPEYVHDMIIDHEGDYIYPLILLVCCRDGSGGLDKDDPDRNPQISDDTMSMYNPNWICSEEDDGDSTYLYYVFRPLSVLEREAK